MLACVCLTPVVQRLCSMHHAHKVDGMYVRISPYYQCENGVIWDANMHVVPVPKPVNIHILPDQLEFVKRLVSWTLNLANKVSRRNCLVIANNTMSSARVYTCNNHSSPFLLN